VTTYTSVLVLGSLFLGTSLTLTARLQAFMARGPVDPGLLAWFNAWVLPFVLSALAFLVAYMAFPNASVAFRSALIGALVGSSLFEVGKFFFARTTGASVNLNILYGSLAALPIFLIWLYYTWIIVLVGLEVAYTHQYRGARSRPSLEQEGLSGFRASLEIYLAIAARFQSKAPPPTTEVLSQTVGYPSDRTAFALRSLAQSGLIHRVGLGQDRHGAWIPATPPDQTKLSSVMRTLAFSGGQTTDLPPAESGLGHFLEAGARALDHRTVADEIALGADQDPPEQRTVV
jgi:membrane protein